MLAGWREDIMTKPSSKVRTDRKKLCYYMFTSIL